MKYFSLLCHSSLDYEIPGASWNLFGASPECTTFECGKDGDWVMWLNGLGALKSGVLKLVCFIVIYVPYRKCTLNYIVRAVRKGCLKQQ